MERPSLDQFRAEALGWLARPAELLQLLLEHAQPTDPDASPASPHEDRDQDPFLSRALAFPADLLATLRTIDPAKLRPRAVLHLHLTDTALTHPETGVARIEDCGPVLATQVATLLAHSHVTVEPVIDLADHIATSAYEHPEPVKDRVWYLTGGRDTFPYATGRSRHIDHDHPTPYVHGGPPGQTGTHNSQPLGRRNHRYKTHAGFRSRQIAPGTYAWATPHGYHYVVGPRGTRPITAAHGTRYFEATTAELAVRDRYLPAA